MNAPTSSSGSEGRFFSPRMLRRVLLILAVVATVVGLFYTEENWRGKRAWERFKREAAARGVNTDWNAFLPPPVPDEQNFFKASNMQKWFTGRGDTEFSRLINNRQLEELLLRRGLLPSVEVIVVPASATVAHGDADLVLQYHRPRLSPASSTAVPDATPAPSPSQSAVQISAEALKEISRIITPQAAVVKPDETSPKLSTVSFPEVRLKSPPVIAPLRIIVRTDSNPTTNEIKEFLPANLPGITNNGLLCFSESNSMRASLVSAAPYISAADYLEWSDSFKEKFDALRAALDRPYARMDGAYENPPYIPIPNFVNVRAAAQMLGRRAQCYLLMGEPDKALNELTLMHHMARLLEGRPTSEPMTLVAAMINVAVKGLYVNIVADGLELQAWHEPQLAAIQPQLAETDLIPYVHDALHMEFASFGRIMETSTTKDLAKLFHPGTDKSFWESLHDPVYVYLLLAPHGWLYQNAVTDGKVVESSLEAFDLTKHLILPQKAEKNMREVEAHIQHPGAYSYLALKAIPNTRMAKQRAAYNQTLVNEAMIVCALERYRLAHGLYPKSLDALVPQFVEKLPRDLIGGGALKYRNEGARFVLYSIGWNETDDGGITDAKRETPGDLSKKDWVWPF